MNRTDEEISEIGLDALVRALGQGDYARFIYLHFAKRGDYTKERQEWVEKITLDDVLGRIKQSRKAAVADQAGKGKSRTTKRDRPKAKMGSKETPVNGPAKKNR